MKRRFRICRVLVAGILTLGAAGLLAGCPDLVSSEDDARDEIADEYTITFDSAGGTPVAPITQEADTPVTAPENPMRDSFHFVDWDPELPATMPAENLTVTARWMHEDLAVIEHREMVSAPGGTFNQVEAIWNGTEGDSFQHTISDFEIARFQVTYELWYAVILWGEANGYTFGNHGREGNIGTDGEEPTADREHEPVTVVSWRDAIVWLNAYSEMVELTPVYYTDPGKTIPIRNSDIPNAIQPEEGSIDNPYVDWDANGYRLPTEGEWQYAASYRDGTDWTPFNYASGATDDFDNPGAIAEVAWYDDGPGRTRPVGTKRANQLGIHDMSGNVFEWIWDWQDHYPPEAQSDYRGPETGSTRGIRGGHWGSTRIRVLVGNRGGISPWGTQISRGFRPARTP